MAILVFETGTERGIVALYEGKKCLYMAGLPFGYHNSRFLLPKIQEGLSLCGLLVEDLEVIGVGVGPGSYTGIRVGAIAAKSLSWSKKVPLAGICTLQTLLPPEKVPFLAMIDAKISGAYVQAGGFENDKLVWMGEPAVVPLDQLGPYLEKAEVIVTPSAQKLEKSLQKTRFYETAPDPQYMALRAEEALKSGETTVDGTLKLLYLRKATPGA